MRLLVLMLACGFQGIPNIGVPRDAGTDLARDLDLAGADLAGEDLAVTPGVDLAGADLTTLISGGGPTGALPAGFCCNSDSDCRSRECVTSTSPSYCSDECDHDAICNQWGPGFACDLQSNRCVATTASHSCHPASSYVHGTKPIGSCCVSGIPSSGQECLGGVCATTGADGNPFYCTQGCDGTTPCPGGYQCFVGFCWITQTVGDPTFHYLCQ